MLLTTRFFDADSRFNTETNDMSTMNSNNRIAATLHSLGTYVVVCLRNSSINTVHKRDDDDDDEEDDNNNNKLRRQGNHIVESASTN